MGKHSMMVISFNLALILILAILLGACSIHYGIRNSRAKKLLSETPVITKGEPSFMDLNKDGKLDVYEDSRQEIDLRIADLLSQMTLEEKAGMIWQPPIGVGKKGQILGKPNLAAKSMNSTSAPKCLEENGRSGLRQLAWQVSAIRPWWLNSGRSSMPNTGTLE
jgi:beta-glucosidase